MNYLKNIWLTGFLLILISFMGKAQHAELEILGRNKEPFVLSINGTIQQGSPGLRILVKSLPPGPALVNLSFSDSTMEILSDTLVLEKDYRIVYRIVRKQQPFPDLVGFVRRIVKPNHDSVQKKTEPETRNLKLIEKVLILSDVPVDEQEKMTSVLQDTSSSTLQHGEKYQFSKERPNPPKAEKNAERPKEVEVATETGTEIVPEKLTEELHQQLLKQLKALRFEEEKVSKTTQSLQNITLTTIQLLEIIHQFDFERTKLDLCKKYYFHLSDKEHALQLSGAFEFNSSQTELKKWIDEQTK